MSSLYQFLHEWHETQLHQERASLAQASMRVHDCTSQLQGVDAAVWRLGAHGELLEALASVATTLGAQAQEATALLEQQQRIMEELHRKTDFFARKMRQQQRRAFTRKRRKAQALLLEQGIDQLRRGR